MAASRTLFDRLGALLYEHGHWRADADPWAARTASAVDVIAIRRATDDDRRTLDRLSALDSAPPLSGPALLAFLDGQPCAALSLADGRVVADPFHPTADAVELLRARAAHLAAERPARRRLTRLPRTRRAWG